MFTSTLIVTSTQIFTPTHIVTSTHAPLRGYDSRSAAMTRSGPTAVMQR